MSAVNLLVKNKLLHVESVGAGPDVVLLHGWGMHSGYWQSLIDELKPRYRLHCIDLPGHGWSKYDNENSLDDFVTRVGHTINSVAEQEYSLIGWSMGGLIAQQLSLNNPDRINHLILISSSVCFMQRPDWQDAMSETVLNSFADALLENHKSTLSRFIALQVWSSDQQQQNLRKLKEELFSRDEPDPKALKIGLSLLQNVDLRRSLGSMNAPVMLIGGERDTLVPAAALAEMTMLLPQAMVHLIKGAGHAPFLSHPDEVVSLVKTFIPHE